MTANETRWSGMSDEWLDATYGTTIHVSRHDEVIALPRANGTSHGSAAKGKPTLSGARSESEMGQPRRKLKAAA